LEIVICLYLIIITPLDVYQTRYEVQECLRNVKALHLHQLNV
jgi:hypothetical protein